jgi:hypothetical protein
MHPAGAVRDEHEDVQLLEQHGVHVQELAPGRARAARRRIDARGMQDLPHRGWRDYHAEFRQLAVDPAVSPQRILLRQPNDKACDARGCGQAARLAPVAHVVLLRGQFAVPGQQRRGRHGKDAGPATAGQEPCQRGEPHPVGRLVPHPAGVPAQHRVLVPEHKQLSILRPVATEHQDSHAEYTAHQQVDDLQQHPVSQPSLRSIKVRTASVISHLSIRAAHA